MLVKRVFSPLKGSYIYSGEIAYDIIEMGAGLVFTFGPKSPIFSGPVHTLIMDEKF